MADHDGLQLVKVGAFCAWRHGQFEENNDTCGIYAMLVAGDEVCNQAHASLCIVTQVRIPTAITSRGDHIVINNSPIVSEV